MQFSHFDLNLLRSLDALLAERNVTRASERLFVTQQAMSGALRRLREHFENELLVRVGRQMELTPLARSLALPVRDALLKVETAVNTQPSFDPRTRADHRDSPHRSAHAFMGLQFHDPRDRQGIRY